MKNSSTKIGHSKVELLLLFLILLLAAGNGIYWGTQKEGYHVDEIYSYGLANSNYLPFAHMGDTGAYDVDDFMQEYGAGNNLIDLAGNVWQDMVLLSKAHLKFKSTDIYSAFVEARRTSNDTTTSTWVTGDYYQDYLTVEPGTGFNYFSVFYNQGGDVHPPLYYLLLHTISSIFQGSFSKWFAFAINLAALMATLILLYQMICRFFGNAKTALATVALYGLGAGFASTMVFFRMYALLTLLTIAYCYLHLALLESGWQFTRKRKRVLILLTFLGFYTQYFFVIYALFMAILTCVILAYRKQFKTIWTYIRQLIWAAVIGVIIWPFSLRHIFFGYRGRGVTNSLLDFASLKNAIESYYYEIVNLMLGTHKFLLWGILILAVTVPVCWFVIRKRTQAKLQNVEGSLEVSADEAVREQKSYAKYFILFLPAALYFIAAAKASPMNSNRYIMNIAPFLMILAALAISYYSKQIGRNLCGRFITDMKKREWIYTGVLTVFTAVILFFTGTVTRTPDYLYAGGQETVEVPDNTVCVYVMPDGYWMEYTKDAIPLSKCEKVAVLFENNLAFLDDFEYEAGQSVMIYLQYDVNERGTIDDVIEHMGIEDLTQTYAVWDGTYTRYLYQ